MSGEWWEARGAESDAARRKERARWRDKFREAFRGVKLGVRGHSSFCVHFFFAALALAAALALGCDLVEWCLIVCCIGLVMTAELFNSAIETLFHGLDADAKKRMGRPPRHRRRRGAGRQPHRRGHRRAGLRKAIAGVVARMRDMKREVVS